MIKGLIQDNGVEMLESNDELHGMDGSINYIKSVIIYMNIFFKVKKFRF